MLLLISQSVGRFAHVVQKLALNSPKNYNKFKKKSSKAITPEPFLTSTLFYAMFSQKTNCS